MSTLQIALYAIIALALAISVVTDLRTRTIKNVVTLPTVLLALMLRTAFEGWGTFGGDGLASGLLGMAVGGLFFYLFARLGGMGMGDVKLVAAVGAAVGFPVILACLMCIGLAGGVQALVVLLWQGKLLKTFSGMGRWVLQKARVARREEDTLQRVKIPYGVAIAFGTVWGVWWYLSHPPIPS
ncbi:MAG TPA: prepilin peptidase [Myxococcales bacterium]|jgi:prepilin peptidase CpaA|nr:prepilin peptidase [Myxococcales bacterium]